MKILMMSSGTINSVLTYRILSFAKSLVKKGHTVTIIAPSIDKYSHYKVEDFKSVDGVNIIRPFQFKTRMRWINLLPYMFHTIKILHSLQYDIIHLYKPTPITIIGFIPKITRRIPVVLDMDDIGSKVLEHENNPYIIVKIVSICESFSLKFANGIICASSYLQNIYAKEYPDKPIVWISNGVEELFFKEHKKKNKENKIVTIGSLNRTNIIEPLIRALPFIKLNSKNKKISVCIIGDGAGLAPLKELSKKLHVYQYITFTGNIPINEIPNKTQIGDIGYAYMPDDDSIKAASNLKIFQYMAMGVVPVVSNVGDLPHYINDGKAGYIAQANNIESLAESIILAMNDNNSRHILAKHSQQFAREHYTWDILANKVEKFYQTI